jgi:hypothetical protein
MQNEKQKTIKIINFIYWKYKHVETVIYKSYKNTEIKKIYTI